MYGVCVTFPKVFPAAVGGNGGQKGQVNENMESADSDEHKPTDIIAMAAPVAESSVTMLKPKLGQKGGGGKERAVRGQSPPRGSGSSSGGRRGRGSEGQKGGSGGTPDTQVLVLP